MVTVILMGEYFTVSIYSLITKNPSNMAIYYKRYYGDVAGKSDYSWIVPLIIVIGFGTLLIPLLGTLMTTMMTQGTINLTAGRRRKRSTTNFLDEL